jgi:hypothetical protein
MWKYFWIHITFHFFFSSDKDNPAILYINSETGKRLISYEIVCDRTRKSWPFYTGGCLIEVTACAGLTVYYIMGTSINQTCFPEQNWDHMIQRVILFASCFWIYIQDSRIILTHASIFLKAFHCVLYVLIYKIHILIW